MAKLKLPTKLNGKFLKGLVELANLELAGIKSYDDLSYPMKLLIDKDWWDSYTDSTKLDENADTSINEVRSDESDSEL